MQVWQDTQLLDGKKLAQANLESLKERRKHYSQSPHLAVIVSETDAPSLAYVNMKQRWALKIGATSEVYNVNESSVEEDIIKHIEQLNANPNVHGILVQHPLPHHLNESKILASVLATKDVDGISPMSIGLLASCMKGHRAATPLGIMRMFEHYQINLRGLNTVVVGCSIILGRPMALMLLEKDATVCIAHKYTTDLYDMVQNADVVISATGVPGLIDGSWLKDGVIAVDCGYSIDEDGEVLGDINSKALLGKAKYITPVPGGVGPMTVATLLSNLFDAYEEQTNE